MLLNLYSSPLLQANFRTEINKMLNDFGVPLIILLFLLGLVHGLATNWNSINSNAPGARKEGFMNALMIFLYYGLAIIIIGVAVANAKNFKLSV